MTRRKSSLSSLLLFAALSHTLFSFSNSESLTTIPSWTTSYRLQTHSPEFNVVASNDGIPTLESGEKAAKDPQIIVEGPLPVDTPEPVSLPDGSELIDDGDIIDPTMSPPDEDVDNERDQDFHPSPEDEEDIDVQTASGIKKEGPPKESPVAKPSKPFESGKKPKSWKKPTPSTENRDQNQEDEVFGASASGDLDDDLSSDVKPSSAPEDDSDLLPEPSLLPASPSFKPSTSPVSNVSKPGKGKQKNASKPKGERETEPEPSSADIGGPDISLPPIAAPSGPHSKQNSADTKNPTSAASASASVLPFIATEAATPPLTPPLTETPFVTDEGGADSGLAPSSSSSSGNVEPDDSYSCVFFGDGDIPNFASAEPQLFRGDVDTYSAEKTSFATLPPQYMSHAYGKSWSYSLPTTENTSYDIVLGFAEIFKEACTSDTGSGFRLFSASVGAQSIEIDVAATVGCAKPLQKMFPKVPSQDGIIKLSFEGLVEKAMLSTMCYRQSEAPEDEVEEMPTASAFPELSVTETTSPPKLSPNKPSTSPENDENSNPFSMTFIQPNAKYRCVNLAAKTFDSYQSFDESSVDGDYKLYKGSGVSLNPTLPMPYRYHAYGKKWIYRLNVSTNLPQEVILGFAEVFPKACASGKNGSFRVFTVSVGDNFQIVDVMKSSGCGVVLQTKFENVKPKDGLIDLNFNAVSGNAMLSVACYADAGGANRHSAAANTTEIDAPRPVNTSTSGASHTDTKQSRAHCFQFGDKIVPGFTNVVAPDLGVDMQVYTGDFAPVKGTSDPDVYKSHIFGPQFTLSLHVGSATPKTVELGFAEIYELGCKDDFRVFTVQAGVESKTVDVFEEVGCNTAFMLLLEDLSPSTSGKIDIVLKSISNFAMVSSVCIIDGPDESESGTAPSLTIVSADSGPVEKSPDANNDEALEASPDDGSESATEASEKDEFSFSLRQTPLPSEESSDDQSDNQPDAEQDSPIASPLPKENGVIVVDSAENGKGTQGNPSGSPLPKVNGVIDASTTTPPVETESPTALVPTAFGTEDGASNEEVEIDGDNGDSGGSDDEGAEASSDSSDDGADPPLYDELLPSDFLQTTLGEGSEEQPASTSDPTNTSSGTSSQPGVSAVSSSGHASPTPSVILSSSPEDGVTITTTSPTRTPIPTVSQNPPVGGGGDNVTNKQSGVTIEAPSPSPTASTVTIEAASPSSTGLTVAIEASPSATSGSVTIVSTGPAISASSTPTPTIISAAAFSPVPSVAILPPSPSSLGENGGTPSNATPQPLATAVQPDTASTSPSSVQSASPAVASSASSGDTVLPPVDSSPTGTVLPQPSIPGNPTITLPPTSAGTPDGSEILPPVNTSPGPQGDPDGSNPDDSDVSPAPSATLSQNQIIVLPSASAPAFPIRTPTPVIASPSPASTPVADSGGTSSGIGAPQGVVTGSADPDSASTASNGSPVPDVVTNPSISPGSSPRATPSPSRATSAVGSSEVIVDSPTSAPSPDAVSSVSVGAPEEDLVEVADNTTAIIQVTGDIGTEGSVADKQPSILVGEYKDLIATSPAGSGFSIGMGILGSLLVILLLVCLFFAIFRGGGAAYSYSSGDSAPKPTDYDPSQGGYTDDLGLGPTGYGTPQSDGQNTQDRYGEDPVTFESRPEGQSEAFGFEMPAAGGLGAPGNSVYRSEEPDTIAEYSNLNLQQTSGYEAPLPQSTDFRRSHDTITEQTPLQSQFPGAHDSITGRTKTTQSYGANPGEYTFTGTFTMPNTGYSQSPRDREYEEYRDPGPAETGAQFQNSSTMQDSFNDHHSIARPIKTSESSGKQQRIRKNLVNTKTMQKSMPFRETRTEVAPMSDEGGLVDDVRSSLLDSEQAPTSLILSMGPNPVAARSPYETKINVDVARSDSGNVTDRNFRPSAQTSWRPLHETAYREKLDTERSAPSFDRDHDEPLTGANSERMHAAHRPVLRPSGSNDEPWPWWWSGDNKEQHRKSRGYSEVDQATNEKENSSLSSNSLTQIDAYQRLGSQEVQKRGALLNMRTSLTPKHTESQNSHRFLPDSNWQRQYSSTSDEDEDETPPDPYFEELRRRREPYVKSVANRLSTGPGSFSMSVTGESVLEQARKEITVGSMDGYELGSAREASSWITRDPVEV